MATILVTTTSLIAPFCSSILIEFTEKTSAHQDLKLSKDITLKSSIGFALFVNFNPPPGVIFLRVEIAATLTPSTLQPSAVFFSNFPKVHHKNPHGDLHNRE